MQYQLESPSKKSVTTALIPDEFNFAILHGEIFIRTKEEGKRDTFVCAGPLYDLMANRKPSKRETMAEQMHRLHGIPTFPPAAEVE